MTDRACQSLLHVDNSVALLVAREDTVLDYDELDLVYNAGFLYERAVSSARTSFLGISVSSLRYMKGAFAFIIPSFIP